MVKEYAFVKRLIYGMDAKLSKTTSHALHSLIIELHELGLQSNFNRKQFDNAIFDYVPLAVQFPKLFRAELGVILGSNAMKDLLDGNLDTSILYCNHTVNRLQYYFKAKS